MTATNLRLADLQHEARQPRLTTEADVEPDIKTRKRPVKRLGGGGRGCNKFVPVLGGDGTKTTAIGDIFGQSPGGMSGIRGKLADHVEYPIVLSPEGAVLVTSPGTESYPRPP